MNRDVISRVLFVVLLIAVLVSAFRVIAPFLAGFTWAAVLVAAFRPLHDRLERVFGGRPRAATAAVTLLVAAFVVVPLLAAALAAVQEGIAAIQWVVANHQSGGIDFGLRDRWPWIGHATDQAQALVGLANIDLRALAISGLETFGSLIAAEGPALVGGAFGLMFSFVVMLVAMPALFANGERLSQIVAGALPIPAADGTRIVGDLTLMTRSVFMSVGLTAAAQAALGGVALLALGVPHAMSLSAGMFFCAMFPGGTAIVWVPAAIWLAATGHSWKAIMLVAWGAGVVSTIDNVLRPVFAGKGVKLPGAELFLGMFGGIAAFGVVGLFLGPIALYMTRELLAILRRETHGAPATALETGGK
jgi:predicted PurR-regulated permease PerM